MYELWEIAQAMQQGKYANGQRFESEGGFSVINFGMLVWEDSREPVGIFLNDSERFKEV